MESSRVERGGVTLHTESFGRPSDPALLLIMGAMASGVWWPEGLCRRLAERGHFVLRYDHRDTGASTAGAPGTINYSVEDLADDAVAVLDHYRVESAHLVGMSLGGFLAQLIALKHPGRVLTLTLVASERLRDTDPSMPPMSPEVTAYHARAPSLDWADREAVIAYQVGAWRLLTGSAHAFDEDAVRDLVEEDLDRTPTPLAAMNHALLSGGERWHGRLDEIQAPALIIHGTEDPVLPYPHAQALARELPRATLLTLPGTGHELHRDDWPAMVDAIARHATARSRRRR